MKTKMLQYYSRTTEHNEILHLKTPYVIECTDLEHENVYQSILDPFTQIKHISNNFNANSGKVQSNPHSSNNH